MGKEHLCFICKDKKTHTLRKVITMNPRVAHFQLCTSCIRGNVLPWLRMVYKLFEQDQLNPARLDFSYAYPDSAWVNAAITDCLLWLQAAAFIERVRAPSPLCTLVMRGEKEPPGVIIERP